MALTHIFEDLQKYDHLFLHVQTEEEARQVKKIGDEILSMRTSAGCSRRELSNALEVDFALITAVEIAIGDLQTAQELLLKVKRHFS